MSYLPSDLLTVNQDGFQVTGKRRLKVDTNASKTAFGQAKSESDSPVTQISAQYGLLQNVLTVTDTDLSGTNSVVDKKFTCESGVSANGLASILSLRQAPVRAGQGLLASFPIIFDTPVADNTQAGGLITAENSFTFAYIGTAFGILAVTDGKDELQELTLTVAASGAETATVTVDGIPHAVLLTGAGSLSDDAFEIATELNTSTVNYNFSSNGATVVAQSVLPGVAGAFTYSSTGVSAGTWVQIQSGEAGATSFIPQASWNCDTRLKGSADSILNPLLNNSYQIQLNGSADFFIEDRESKEMALVHRMSFVNVSTENNPANSTFRVGWIVNNTGNTSNVTIQGGKSGLFNEGAIFYDALPRGFSNTQTIPAGADTQTSVLILRNRLSFAESLNRSEVLPLVIQGSTESNKVAEFRLLLNPTFSSPVNFQYANKENSIIEVSYDSVVVTGGLEISQLTVEAGNPQTIKFNQSIKTTNGIYPGSVLAIVATLKTGAGGECTVSETAQEDL